MTTPDATAEVVEALKQYFSAPIARALVTSTLRRAKIDAATFQRQAIPEVITALESALPMYIADPGRRGECVGRLRKLTQESGNGKANGVHLAAPASAGPSRAEAKNGAAHLNGLPAASTIIQV